MSRKLTEEEQRVWTAVLRSVRPLEPKKPLPRTASPASVAPLPAETRAAAARPRPATPRASVPARPEKPAVPQVPALAPLSRRETKKVVRGVIEIDARLDLHGFTQAEAHAVLHRFLAQAQARDARWVLVITGKGGDGDPFARSRGVLRRQVPHWLSLPEFRALVTGFDAATGHGGTGALYVRIRRRR
ncbi:Smr protein/MutS2 [Rhodovulum sp. PH10]|uniref:Smr/MutS family protein n=1 Tax=Rhodovulum sp. PH10 TaxID=1187851 RepID=UPI00027C249C|nr:Smr/MutS family protein [Rhodovulum sp. PH10]EJW13082.1 Smr protein/MutS2 [Rhodovulum sp. PH10]